MRITAPFITVGSSPARYSSHATMPVVVDLPLVPATPTDRGAALNSSASNSARARARRALADGGPHIGHGFLHGARGDQHGFRSRDAAAVLGGRARCRAHAGSRTFPPCALGRARAKRGIKKTARIMVIGIPTWESPRSSTASTVPLSQRPRTGRASPRNQWIKITPYLELLDTPGMLPPKLDDQARGKAPGVPRLRARPDSGHGRARSRSS